MIGNVYETNDSRRKRRIRVKAVDTIEWGVWPKRAICEIYDYAKKKYFGKTTIRTDRLNPHGGWRLVKMGK